MAIFVLQLTLRPAKLAAAVGRHAVLFVIVVIFSIGAFLTSRVGNSGGTRLLLDQIVGPFLLFWLVVAFAHEDRRLGLVLRNAIIFAVAAECVLAIVQKSVGSIIFYQDDYLRFYWFNPEPSSGGWAPPTARWCSRWPSASPAPWRSDSGTGSCGSRCCSCS